MDSDNDDRLTETEFIKAQPHLEKFGVKMSKFIKFK